MILRHVGNSAKHVGGAGKRAAQRGFPTRPLATGWPTIAHVASSRRDVPIPTTRPSALGRANKLCLQARLFPRALAFDSGGEVPIAPSPPPFGLRL